LPDEALIKALLSQDPQRWQILDYVRSLGLPDCWIGAGFVRNAVWDHLHGRPPAPVTGDVDVVWFDPTQLAPATDTQIEARLRNLDFSIDWSVKNQARMHLRNADPGYASTFDALSHWPETATAIAVRRTATDDCDICAPFGFADLLALQVRPTPSFIGQKYPLFLDRVRQKQWLEHWPLLKLAEP